MSTINLQQRLNDLSGYIRQGKIIDSPGTNMTASHPCSSCLRCRLLV